VIRSRSRTVTPTDETRIALLERLAEDHRHRARNDRMKIEWLSEELARTRRDLAGLRAQVLGGVAVIAASVPIAIWLAG
jgi:hypothetical protein